MKFMIIILCMVFFSHLGIGKETKVLQNNVKAQRTIITGNFHPNISSVNVKVEDLSTYREFTADSKTSFKVDSLVKINNGKLVFEMQINHPVSLRINNNVLAFTALGTAHGIAGFLMEPGDSLNVDFNTPNPNHYSSLVISGRGSEKHLCIQKILENMKKFTGPGIHSQKSLSYKLSSMDSITNEIMITVSKFKLSQTARSIILADYITMLAGSITDHILDSKVNIHSPVVKKIFMNRVTSSYRYVDDIKIKSQFPDANNLDLKYTLTIFFVSDLLKRGLMKYAMETNIPYPNSVSEHAFHKDRIRTFKSEQYDALDRFIPDGPIKEKALSYFIFHGIRTFGFNQDTKAASKKFIAQTNPKSSFHLAIKALYDKYENRLKRGADAYPFELPDTSGKIVKLSDFKGKVVVLDFMFTGCGGCATMVPYLTKVEHAFADKDVIFIAVSVSKELPDVKKGSGNYCTEGSLLLHTDGKMYKHPIIEAYNIRAFPQLVVIDRKGKILDTNAPRAHLDDGRGLTKMIEEALNNK